MHDAAGAAPMARSPAVTPSTARSGRPAKSCTFCEIIAGHASAHVVLDEPHAVAFLDVKPLFVGHTLLAPRDHVPTLSDLPAEETARFFATAQRLDRAVVSAMGSQGSMVLINNVVSQSVPHLHLHVIPRTKGDGLRFWLGPRTRYRSAEHADETARAIAKAQAALGT